MLASVIGVEPTAFRLGGGPSILLRYTDVRIARAKVRAHDTDLKYFTVMREVCQQKGAKQANIKKFFIKKRKRLFNRAFMCYNKLVEYRGSAFGGQYEDL